MRGWWKAVLPGLLLGASAGAAPPESLTGRWSVSAELFGERLFMELQLDQQGDALTGTYDGGALTGTRSGKHMHVVAQDGDSDSVTDTLEA